MRWQNSLRSHGSVDWVIIVVESNDSKKKNKANILPRSSISDKIRSDFCNKQNDRWVSNNSRQGIRCYVFLSFRNLNYNDYNISDQRLHMVISFTTGNKTQKT